MLAEPPRPFVGNDEFFRAINPIHWEQDSVRPRAFKPKAGNGLSVDWAELITAKESARRWVLQWGPTRLAVLTAHLVWDSGLHLRYSAEPNNKAHCEILGELLSNNSPEGTQVRVRLARECRVIGPFE